MSELGPDPVIGAMSANCRLPRMRTFVGRFTSKRHHCARRIFKCGVADWERKFTSPTLPPARFCVSDACLLRYSTTMRIAAGPAYASPLFFKDKM